jgi:hypothetical protein
MPKTLLAIAAAASIVMFAEGTYAQCVSSAQAAQPKSPGGTLLPTTSRIPYKWSTSTAANAAGYQVYVRSTSAQTFTADCSIANAANDGCDGNSLPSGSYEWFVRTFATSGCTSPTGGTDSSTLTFTIAACNAPGAPALSSPSNNSTITNNPPTLTWTAASGADKYDIHLGTTATPGLVSTTQATSYTPQPLSPGSYSWFVDAYPNCDTTKRTRSSTFSFTIPATCPNATTLLSPSEGASVPSGNVTFSWQAVTGATSYTIFAGINGATPTQVSQTTATSVTTVIDGGKSIEWYVTSTVPNCSDKTSAHGHFTTVTNCPTTGPTISAPASGSTFDDSKPITLTWTAVTGATSYDILVSSDNGASFTQKASVGSSFTSTSLSFNAGSYVVVIRANVTGCSSLFSQPATRFTVVQAVVCPTTKPGLQTPANGATVTLPVTFDWDDISGASEYNVYVVTSSVTNATTLVGSSMKSELTMTSLPSGTTAWFVQALFPNCPVTESSHNAITISSASTCPTKSTTLTSPANGATDIKNSVDLDWTDVDGAVSYRVLVGVNGGTPTAIGVTSDSHLSTTIQSGTIEWYVETIFSTQCPAVASSHFTFTIAATATCNTTAPTIVSPQDGATNLASPVTLQWTPVPTATLYRVFAAVGITSTDQIGETTSTSLSAQLPAGNVTWYVQAILPGNCASTVSKRATFTVTSGTQCKNSPATLVSPADGAPSVKSPVTFQWMKVDGATDYELFVSYNGGAFEDFGGTTGTQLEKIIPAGSIAWYVVTSFAGCDDVKSSTSHFTVVNPTCPNGTITLNTPGANATVTSPVNFSWTGITGALAYRLWVSSNGEAFVILTRVTTTSASVTLPSGSVEWYIEAIFNDSTTIAANACPSIESAHSKFTVQKAANCDANKGAIAVSPTGTINTTSVDFNWNAAAGAIAYRLWIAASGQPFADVAFVKNATKTTRDLVAGSYTWYVETLFDGCPALLSNQLAFKVVSATARCSNAAPTAIAPADNATNVSSPVTFLWSSVTDAEEYRLFIGIDGGDMVFVGQTDDTSMTLPLLPGTIRWFVEATFKGCPSTRSARSKFTVPKANNCGGDTALLVAPASGAVITNPDVELIWNAVNGASHYTLWIQHNDGTPTAVDRTTDTHDSIRLPDGKFDWWVTTFTSGCPTVDSAHSPFTIPKPDDACDNKKPQLRSPSDGSVVTQPVVFSWTPVARAVGYKIFASFDGDSPNLVDTTGAATESHPIALPTGTIHWFVQALFNAPCNLTRSAIGNFKVVKPPACAVPAKPVASLAAHVATDTIYVLRWNPVANADKYEVEESTTLDFSNASHTIVTGTNFKTSHTVTAAPVQYLYRVRAISNCSDEHGPYSDVVSVFVIPLNPQSKEQHTTGELGFNGNIVQTLFLPGSTSPTTFLATVDRPYLSVVPSSGILQPQGITLNVIATGGMLNPGTNTGTVHVVYGAPITAQGAHTMVTQVSIPVSISLVTPITPGGKNTPPPDSLIIPALGHSGGIGGALFQSDVRLANVSAQTMKYLLNFTPAASDGTLTGNSTQIQVDPGATMALNDIMANFFGSTGTVGTLEIRPLTSTTTTSAFGSTTPLGQSLTTVVSSRTYNNTPNGTYGQFVPAIPFAQFIAKSPDSTQKQILSLQQIAQSTAFRTNVGVVEGAGEPVSVLLSVFDNAGNLLGQIPESLPPGGFLQFDHVLQDNGITLTDGRIEVEVTSPTGRVTAYASVLDNITSDPLAVSPVLKSSVGSNRYVLPGVGDFDIGFAHWKSDVRVFNAGATRAATTLTYYPQGNGTPQSKIVNIDPGQVLAIDNFIASTFPATATAGSLVVTTPSSSSLVVTGRTYTDQGPGKGTYGQFIPAVTPADATGLGGRTLQVLQLEASDQFRSNIGLVETTGNAVDVELAVILPDSRVTPKTTYHLAPNDFRQISLGADFGLQNVYNVRATVRVVGGTGKVTSFGSVIDATTQDPTYVPAQ